MQELENCFLEDLEDEDCLEDEDDQNNLEDEDNLEDFSKEKKKY